MLIGNVKKNGLNHFIEVGKHPSGAKNYSSLCNIFVAGWYDGKKEPLNLRDWCGEKICVSCALKAYKMELVDLIINNKTAP